MRNGYSIVHRFLTMHVVSGIYILIIVCNQGFRGLNVDFSLYKIESLLSLRLVDVFDVRYTKVKVEDNEGDELHSYTITY